MKFSDKSLVPGVYGVRLVKPFQIENALYIMND